MQNIIGRRSEKFNYEIYYVNCFECDKEFQITPSRLSKNKIHSCSRQCSGKINSRRYKKEINKKCLECQIDFVTIPSRDKSNNLCSRKCTTSFLSKKYVGHNNPNSNKLSEYEKYFYNKSQELQRRSLIKNLECDITYKDLIEIFEKQKKLCYYTGLEITPVKKEKSFDTLSFDRKDSNKGYTKDNIVICLLCINYLKSNFKIEDIKYIFKIIATKYKEV